MAKTMRNELANLACCAAAASEGKQEATGKKTIVLLATDSLGQGDAELGWHIVVNFLRTVKEMGDDLWRLVLLNGAVKLAVEGRKPCPICRSWRQTAWASWSAAPV